MKSKIGLLVGWALLTLFISLVHARTCHSCTDAGAYMDERGFPGVKNVAGSGR